MIRRGLTHPLFLATAALVTVADLASKAWAWELVERHGQRVGFDRQVMVLEPYFRIVRAENTGTVWGLFQDATIPLIVVRLVMVIAILVLAWRTGRQERWKLVGFGLVVGGAVGNLYDNLFRTTRAVRDFLDFHIPLPWRDELWHYPTFNVADASILCGAVVLFLVFSRTDHHRAEATSGPEGEA